ncbi:MAG: hypothetical protein ACFFDW_06545 [Candidatus Thorarchaeota archaeon]
MRKESLTEEQLIAAETFLEIREFEKVFSYLNEIMTTFKASKKRFPNKKEICSQLEKMMENITEILVLQKDKCSIEGEIAFESLVWYNFACIYSLKENKIKSISLLKKAQSLNPLIKEMAVEEESLNYALWSKKTLPIES